MRQYRGYKQEPQIFFDGRINLGDKVFLYQKLSFFLRLIVCHEYNGIYFDILYA
jgi:hypothetical protein